MALINATLEATTQTQIDFLWLQVSTASVNNRSEGSRKQGQPGQASAAGTSRDKRGPPCENFIFVIVQTRILTARAHMYSMFSLFVNPNPNPIPIPSQSSFRDFGYDYDYGYGYVKSVDSMDNVNSVRSAGPIVNSMDNVDNSAVIPSRRG